MKLNKLNIEALFSDGIFLFKDNLLGMSAKKPGFYEKSLALQLNLTKKLGFWLLLA
jgi:hypothetical protein